MAERLRLLAAISPRAGQPAHPDPKETEPYDPEADFAATGTVVCGDCGRRVRPKTLESLPEHGCGRPAWRVGPA